MNVFKYSQIVVSDYALVENKIVFNIRYNDFVEHKELEVPPFIDKDILFDIYRLALCVAGYSYALVAENVTVDIPISEAQCDFLERIRPSFYSNLRVFLGNIMMAPSCIADVYFTVNANFKERLSGRLIPNTAVLLYSGGKESLLSSIILDEAGIQYDKLLVNSGLYSQNGICNFKDSFIVDTSKAFLFTESVIYDGTWDNPSFAFERIVIAMAYMISNRKQYLCVGNEYETTAISFDNFGGSLSYGRSWQQSNFALREFQRYLYFIGYGGELFSPVQNMTAVYEEAALSYLYPDRLDEQCSCIGTIVENGKLQPCLTCIKCKILNATLAGFNKINEKNGLPKIKSVYITDEEAETVKSTPVHYPEHFLDDGQLEQLERLCKGDFDKSWFCLIFDQLHSKDFIPNRVRRVILSMESSLKNIVEKWKN